jgi:hypothetical protein
VAEDPIRAYQDALTSLAQIEKRAEGFASYIVDAGESMKHWRETGFSNMSGLGFPPALERVIDASRWPTGEDVASALSQHHGLLQQVQNTWGAIPNDRRVGLQPPAAH